MSKIIGKVNGEEIRGYDFENCDIKSIGEDELEITGSTEDIDRDGEVIISEGWDLKHYKRNPVVLAGHDYRQPAIAKATSIKIEDKKLKFRIKFPPEGDYPLADVYRKLYKGGFMKASSVGFRGKEWIDGNGDEKKPIRTFTKQELLELSLVTVPANPAALSEVKGIKEAVQKGVLTAGDAKVLKEFAEQVMKGVEDGNEVKKLGEVQAIEGDATPAGGQDDKGAGGNEGEKEIKELQSETQRLSDAKKALEAKVANLLERVEAMEPKLMELSAPKSYLDIEDPMKDKEKTKKDIAEIASHIF